MRGVLQEGCARIRVPQGNQVFYNKAQVINRDLSVAALQAFVQQKSKPQSLLEALSATGLRSIRYTKEIQGIGHIRANDLSESAVSAIKDNLALNEISSEQVSVSQGDANQIMRANSFDIIDLDPYGTAAPFLDAAIASVNNKGMICITCTDMRILAGRDPAACFLHYGTMPIKHKAFGELALRTLLHAVQTAAAKQKKIAKPLLSLSIDFYIRVFVQITNSPAKARQLPCQLARAYMCKGCESIDLEPLAVAKGNDGIATTPNTPFSGSSCRHCGSGLSIGGPYWTGPIHDLEFVNQVIDKVRAPDTAFKYVKHIEGMLVAAVEELENPLYVDLPSLCRIVKSTTPQLAEFRSALVHAGYKVSGTHCLPTGIKTDAPMDVVWDIIRSWGTLKVCNPRENTPGFKIMCQAPKISGNFEVIPDQVRDKSITRYAPNPTADWGPMSRAASGKKHSKRERDAQPENNSCEEEEESIGAEQDSENEQSPEKKLKDEQ
jgi:tRNA (guanine26-N2/guanine27-N2)-dimethyltransferase